MSLIELLIVMALILVLFVLYYNPGGFRYQRRAQKACEANLRTLHLVLEMYAGDHSGRYPALKSARTSEPVLSLLVPQWTSRTAPFICPGSRHRKLPEARPFADRRISYAYLMGLTNPVAQEVWLLTDSQVDTRARRAGEPLFSTESRGLGANHRQFGGNVLFGDGHVDGSPAAARWDMPQPPGSIALNPKP
jgi:prepilin-type processing-associated H-X9-DG protein